MSFATRNHHTTTHILQTHSTTNILKTPLIIMDKLICLHEQCKRKAMKHGNGCCHLHGECRKCSYPQCSNYVQSHGICVQHGYKKKPCSNDGCTNNAIRNGVCISHGAKHNCTIPECGKPLFQAQRCSTHFLCLSLAASEFDSTMEDILAAANAMVGMHHDASFTTWVLRTDRRAKHHLVIA